MAFDFWTDLARPLGISAVVGVWLYHKGKRDSSCRALIEYIDSMAEKGVEYWSTPESEERAKLLASQIKQLSARIGRELVDLSGTYYSFRFKKQNFSLVTAFRQSITSNPFEVTGRQIDRNRATTIERRRAELVRGVRKAQKLI